MGSILQELSPRQTVYCSSCFAAKVTISTSSLVASLLADMQDCCLVSSQENSPWGGQIDYEVLRKEIEHSHLEPQ